jgi:hypothetical protein
LREVLVVVAYVQIGRQHHLFIVVEVDAPLRPVLGVREGWQQHRCQYRNNRNYHQKFDKCKRLFFQAARWFHGNHLIGGLSC